ncbi:MAG TPA: anti-adapter protein IraP [Buttiauxella sp.]|jgi:hypothetical protein
MKNLIAELLVKLAEKEEESKEFVAQIEALEIVVTALLRRMEQSEQQALITSIEAALHDARPKEVVTTHDTELLEQYLKKLLTHPRS